MATKTQYFDVIIAGAGIIGASIAYHLDKLGMSVALLDADGPAAAASGASDGAVSICSKKPGVMARLAIEALDYCELLAQKGASPKDAPLAGVFAKRSSYYFSSSDVENQALDRLAAQLNQYKSAVQIKSDLSGSAGIAALGNGVQRVMEINGEGHMIGYLAVDAFIKNSSISRKWPCKLLGYNAGHSKIHVETNCGEMTAGKLILAMGVSTKFVAPFLPIFSRSGQLIITDRAADGHELPGMLTAASYLLSKNGIHSNGAPPPIVIDPLSTGQFLIGSTREDHGTSRHTDFITVKNLISRAAEVYPPLLNNRIIRVFAGVRAAVSDGMPIVGEMPNQPNVIVATGFEGDGISLSALIGREITSLIDQGQMLPDLKYLSPTRFLEQVKI